MDDRKHGPGAAGAGDVGSIDDGEFLGLCPSCGADLRSTFVPNPRTGRVQRALVHPIPFCTYYGETDPVTIECDIKSARKEN